MTTNASLWLDTFSTPVQSPQAAHPLTVGDTVTVTTGSYSGQIGRITQRWTRQDKCPMADVALDAGYVVSVRVGSVGRAAS